MKISTLIQHIPQARLAGDGNLEVADLHYDSRKATPGCAFFALRGEVADGHRYIDDAVDRGAVAVFCEEPVVVAPQVAVIQVPDTRVAMAHIAAVFFDHPTAGIPVVGVTGTNGKTTVTYLVESILLAAGKKPAVFGTISCRYGERELPSQHTTPESVDLLRTAAEFRRMGMDSLIMEVSSHALEQHRVAGVQFDVGIFTNLTPEHLDYHGDMESYFASKSRLFNDLLPQHSGQAVINAEDPFGQRLIASIPESLTCGSQSSSLVRAEQVQLSRNGISAKIHTPSGSFDLESCLVGEFNLHNLLCAAGAGIAMGISPQVVGRGLCEAKVVPGRLERIENTLGALVAVDYAHTGDALEKVLVMLRGLKPRRLVCVFGCGGDRDRTKRPAMGEIGARLADLSVITSDNPRTEDPELILEEVCEGARKVFSEKLALDAKEVRTGKGFVAIADRGEAIRFAVGVIGPGDVLLVAGKGHEDYQILGTKRIHFDDREELRRALTRRR